MDLDNLELLLTMLPDPRPIDTCVQWLVAKFIIDNIIDVLIDVGELLDEEVRKYGSATGRRNESN